MGLERVLIVDDNDANILFFEMLLSGLGFSKILKARTGPEGLEVAKKEHAQFLVVTWEMTGLPGTIFIQRARQSRKKRYLPAIIYSKRMTVEDVQLTKELGYKDILNVPFDKADARKLVTEMIERENNLSPIESQLRKVEGYLLEDKPSEALKLMDNKILTSTEQVSRVHTAMADIWFKMAKFDKAEEEINAATKHDPAYNPALALKAKLFSRQGKHEEAIQILQGMISTSPRNFTNKISLGSAFIQADRDDDAKKVLAEVMELDGDNQEAKDALATVAFKEGDISLATQLIAETESGDDLARVFNNLAISQVNKGEFERSIDTYRNAMKLLADKAKVHLLHYNLGLAYKKKGDLINCFQELCESYLLEPSFEKAYASLANTSKELLAKGVTLDKDLVQKVKAARKRFQDSNSGDLL
ncbi:MAG: tetratricopeptide repeat protein [Oligoflexales bacterium]